MKEKQLKKCNVNTVRKELAFEKRPRSLDGCWDQDKKARRSTGINWRDPNGHIGPGSAKMRQGQLFDTIETLCSPQYTGPARKGSYE